MSEFKNLLHTLEAELKKQEALLRLLAKETSAIVALNNDEIQQVNKEKEQILLDAIAIEQQRNSIIRSIAEAKKLKAPIKLSLLLQHCQQVELQRRLTRVGAELRSTADSVQRVNEQNAELIRQSLGIIGSTLAIFRQSPGSELPTYGSAGNLRAKLVAATSGFSSEA